jgi:hypothetical protein
MASAINGVPYKKITNDCVKENGRGRIQEEEEEEEGEEFRTSKKR